MRLRVAEIDQHSVAHLLRDKPVSSATATATEAISDVDARHRVVGSVQERGSLDSPVEGDGFEPSVPHRAARRCSARKRRSSHIPPISARLPLEQEPTSWVTTDARVTRRRDRRLSPISQANLDLFLVEMPGRAPPYKGERDSNANGRHPR